MKIITALRAPDLGDALLAPSFREDLRAAGAARIQVNLVDDAVAPARRFGPGVPVTAVVSVWTGQSAPDAVVDVVRRLDATVDAWGVEEREPLVPPVVPDGERTDALAAWAFLRRPPTMEHDAWLSDWLGRHTQVAIDTQGTFGYAQHPVVEYLTPGGRDVTGIVEELFPMAAMTDHHAFYGTGGDEEEFQRRYAAMMASCALFDATHELSIVPTSRYRFELA